MDRGLSIELTCSVTGIDNRVDNIEWYRDNLRLVTSSRKGVLIQHHFSSVKHLYTSSLIVRRVDLKDSGAYTCRITDQRSKVLNVNIRTGRERVSGKLFSLMTELCLSFAVVPPAGYCGLQELWHLLQRENFD